MSAASFQPPRPTILLVAFALLLSASAGLARPALSQFVADTKRPDVMVAAEQAVASGRPLVATQLLAPLLAKPGPREPAVVLLAARAAAGWQGWGTVLRLLAGPAVWLDELSGGEGRALLATARVESGQAPVEDARQAVRTARGEAVGPRLLTLARAFDRANLLDSAAAAYLGAASQFPSIADWLELRAAGVTPDSTARAALYRKVALPAALPRIRWTEALARDRTGDWSGAASIYEALGATVAAARQRLRGARANPEDVTALAVVRRELIGLLTPRLSSEDSRDVIALLDDAFHDLSPEEELLVARRATLADPARAAKAFGRIVAAAPRAKPLTDNDRLTYASVLQRLGRHQDAVQLLGTIRVRELQPQVLYLKGRSLLAQGSREQALAALRQAALASGDSLTSATAGYLRADLLVDDGEELAARQAYLEVAQRFPRTSHGARAAFQAALLAWIHGDKGAAAIEFAELAERAGETTEGIAALYWSGRTLWARGDTGAAQGRWRSLIERFPGSYYTVPAAERLRSFSLREPPPVPMIEPDSNVAAALDRAALLQRLGLRVEARFEYDYLVRQAEGSPAGLLRVARAFAERGIFSRSFRLALRLGPEGQRMAFPLPDVLIQAEARQAGVDPLLAAALIRQESAFDPAARSRADARGLMQVLPSVGAGLAPAAGIGEWDPALLYQPEINVRFGMVHLAQTLKEYPLLSAALAVYNAGPRPTARWQGLPGAADLDVFIERIQYVETRDYVRRVLKNLSVYRALYPALP